MTRRCFGIVILLLLGCTRQEYRFERINGDELVPLPLKLIDFRGIRDGATVTVQARFAEGQDSVTMNVDLFLRPPAEFRAGTYQGTIAGKTVAGAVDCPSLTFQGGQTALPTVGGLFVLKDEQGRSAYRIRIPATPLSHL